MAVITIPQTNTIRATVVERAAANLPQTAQEALFTITGGKVTLTRIVGEITTIIQTQANNTKLVYNPTVGSDVDICAVTDITAGPVGGLLTITGTATDALVTGNNGNVAGQALWRDVMPGTFDLNCAASNTGQIKWTIHYIPIDKGATIVSA
jgi:hypothetical protein